MKGAISLQSNHSLHCPYEETTSLAIQNAQQVCVVLTFYVERGQFT